MCKDCSLIHNLGLSGDSLITDLISGSLVNHEMCMWLGLSLFRQNMLKALLDLNWGFNWLVCSHVIAWYLNFAGLDIAVLSTNSFQIFFPFRKITKTFLRKARASSSMELDLMATMCMKNDQHAPPALWAVAGWNSQKRHSMRATRCFLILA